MGCLRNLDPWNVAVKRHVRKECVAVKFLAQALHDKGLGRLVSLRDGAVHDCPLGDSRRRPDLRFKMSNRFVVLWENDEKQHRRVTTSCENAKIAGTLIDLGAPGYTHEEDALFEDANASVDIDDNLALYKKRQRAIARVLRDARKKQRDGEAMPKVFLIRWNCDEYVDFSGVERPSLFQPTHVQKNESADAVETIALTEEGEEELKKVADRLIELYNLQLDEAWWTALPELTIEYRLYDGQ